MSKIKTLQQAGSEITAGSSIAIGGNVLHRAPMALVRELARQELRDLSIIKTAGAMDVDLLCFAGCAKSVDAGFISYESRFGLANHYRKAVQDGIVAGNEHACYTVISALRAASAGIPFMPVKGLTQSDLIAANDYFTVINDPFSQNTVTVVKALVPDFAILHVHKADELGNAIIEPPVFDDALIARAAKKVIITAEEIVSAQRMRRESASVNIPGLLVHSVVPLSGGAKPCSCPGAYDISERDVESFRELKVVADLLDWLRGYEAADYRGGSFI